MDTSALTAIGLLVLALGLFAWGRIRHDIAALTVLLLGILSGVVPADEAFLGFGHPAVISVVAVLILSDALARSGAVESVARTVLPTKGPMTFKIAAVCAFTAALSGFINNVGALALLMPAVIALARNADEPVAAYLMPMSFASMLGGMTTMIGTPPNLIIAQYRASVSGEAFGLFDFAPVGVGVALAGILVVALLGHRLIPSHRKSISQDVESTVDYLTEVRVTAKVIATLPTIADLQGKLESSGMILALHREERWLPAMGWLPLEDDDQLVVRAGPDTIQRLLRDTGLELTGAEHGHFPADRLGDVISREAVVPPESPIIGQSVTDVNFRRRFGVNVIAVARRGAIRAGLKRVRFAAGDVLVLQGLPDQLEQAIDRLSLILMGSQGNWGGARTPVLGITALAVAGVLASAFGLLPIHAALMIAVGAALLLRYVSPNDAQRAVDWPIVILLAALIPVGTALETTGAVSILANGIFAMAGGWPGWALIMLILIVTMMLSDVLNNAATAVMMAPLARQLADVGGYIPDAFLMAVAVGASCAFLTPIGHQNNLLVMGPGGYRFWDYWRLGLPLEVAVVIVGVPLILTFWPLAI